MSNNPLIWVDLIEDIPLTRDEYAARWQLDPQDVDADYGTYRNNFQPWRIIVKSGSNHEDLFKSTERYFNAADARHAADIAFGPKSNVYLRQKEHGNVALRLDESTVTIIYAQCGQGCRLTAPEGTAHPLAWTCGHGSSFSWAQAK